MPGSLAKDVSFNFSVPQSLHLLFSLFLQHTNIHSRDKMWEKRQKRRRELVMERTQDETGVTKIRRRGSLLLWESKHSSDSFWSFCGTRRGRLLRFDSRTQSFGRRRRRPFFFMMCFCQWYFYRCFAEDEPWEGRCPLSSLSLFIASEEQKMRCVQ